MIKEDAPHGCLKSLMEATPARIWGTIPKTKEGPTFFVKDGKIRVKEDTEDCYSKTSTRKKK